MKVFPEMLGRQLMKASATVSSIYWWSQPHLLDIHVARRRNGRPIGCSVDRMRLTLSASWTLSRWDEDWLQKTWPAIQTSIGPLCDDGKCGSLLPMSHSVCLNVYLCICVCLCCDLILACVRACMLDWLGNSLCGITIVIIGFRIDLIDYLSPIHLWCMATSNGQQLFQPVAAILFDRWGETRNTFEPVWSKKR